MTIQAELPEPPDTTREGLLLLTGQRPSPALIRDDRSGGCYELSWQWMLEHSKHLTSAALASLSPQLVHGSIQGGNLPRIGHAWVELNYPGVGRIVQEVVYCVWMPRDDFYAWTSSRVSRRYDAHISMVMAGRTGHYGPWHPRPFGLDDCPHGHQPHGCLRGDKGCGGKCAWCSPLKPTSIVFCKHGCINDTLKET